ncbi:MAG: VOC family protein [Ruminiclostridium sp.]
MRFSNTLIAVRDMERSLKFYKELFGLDVAVDLGWNKTLTCGLTLQFNFHKIADFPEETMKFRSNTMELYFETEDFDGFISLLEQHPEVERLHEPKTFPWKQRGIHIFDPDGHLLEVSESMETVARREFEAGRSAEETAEIIQHPLPLVKMWYDNYLKGDSRDISVCGADCKACSCLGSLCKGCNAAEGKVFHSPEGCPIHNCAKGEKKLKSCGECSMAPCRVWRSTRDPMLSDEAFENSINERLSNLGKK